MKFTLFSAVYFSIGWMNVVSSGDGRSGTCCLQVTNTRPPVENIVKYEMQESTGICAIRAVRFYTKGSKTICSDPDSKYAKTMMYKVDGRTTAKPTMCFTSTTNTIPIVTTTNKTPGTQTETSKSTSASRIVTTIETSRPETETSKRTTASRIATAIVSSRPATETSKKDWVQDYTQSLTKRTTTEKTDQRDFANNYFCLKKEQVKYFCIKQP